MTRHANSQNQPSKVFIYIVLCLFIFIFAFPFYYMMVLATVPGTETYRDPPHITFKGSLMTNIERLFRIFRSD